ncbi:MAG: nitroreductase family protein [Bacillota bacterium]
MNQVIEAIANRRSIRRYQERPVEPGIITALLEAATRAPNAVNRQPWSFVVVQDPERRARLADVSRLLGVKMNQVAQAPLVVAVLGNPRTSSFLDYDCSLAAGNLMLAAHSLGLGTCWVGAFDSRAVQAILAVPHPWKVVALITIGYPAQGQPAQVRLPLEHVVHYETFGGAPGFSWRRGPWSFLGKVLAKRARHENP